MTVHPVESTNTSAVPTLRKILQIYLKQIYLISKVRKSWGNNSACSIGFIWKQTYELYQQKTCPLSLSFKILNSLFVGVWRYNTKWSHNHNGLCCTYYRFWGKFVNWLTQIQIPSTGESLRVGSLPKTLLIRQKKKKNILKNMTNMHAPYCFGSFLLWNENILS
jgi:hypothetical protein